MKNVGTYTESSVIDLEKKISKKVEKVELTGRSLTINEIISAAYHKPSASITSDKRTAKRLNDSYEHMIGQVKKGVPIYGCNSGYGGRAGNLVNNGSEDERMEMARRISESIVHTDVGVGPVLPVEIVRAAMLIRVNMLVNGVSAVRKEDLQIYLKMLNKRITPLVNGFGGLGASGDLPQNSRVLSAARQLDHVYVFNEKGDKSEAKKALPKAGIPKLVLEPKAGLGLVNGDNFSTAAAAILSYEVLKCLIIADVLGAMTIEVLRGSNRSFHPFLAKVRPHQGQKEVSEIYVYLLNGSKLAYQELSGHVLRDPGVIIQDAYSLRCLSQSDGFSHEFIKWAFQTVEINANSVSDNPLWVAPEYVTPNEKPWQWVSGGNFFGMHTGEVIDGLRKIITRLVKRNDRQLHRMVCPQSNNGLPANLSDTSAISACAFKGFQLQSGMFDVYSMILSQPVTTLFGIHEEANQDITPHSMTSALLAFENIRILKYSLAMNLIAVAQAVDLRGGPELLSERTQPVYGCIRKAVKYTRKEQPLSYEIEKIYKDIDGTVLIDCIREKVFSGFSK